MQNSSRKSALGITMVLVAVVVAILVLFTIQGWNLRQEVSESKVSEATRAVREKYLEISAPVSRDLSLLAKWGEARILDIRETRQLNDKFMPLLESQAMVSSLILADTDGREYFLLREGASWLTRSSEEFRSGMQVNLNRWSTGGDLLETWREKRTFDPRNRSWFAGALQLTGSGIFYWTEPYRFKTVNKLGITASVRWQTKSDDRVITVAALDILLDDLYRFLSGLQISPGAQILIIRNDGSLMAPRKANQSQKAAGSHDVSFISSEDLEEGLFKDAMGVWEKARTETFTAKRFSSQGRTWWAGFKPMQTEDSGAWIGVIIPEKDLAGNFRQRWLHVKNLLNQHIGAEFSRYIDCDLKTINGKTIVVITCEKVTDPVFLAVGKNEDFFIRSGPSSIRLSMSKMVKYLQQRK
jgi:hypothetical protein